jgi:hypothetical protein
MGIRKIIREELEDWEWAMDDKITMDDLEVGDIVEIKNLTTWWYSTINDCSALEYFIDVEEGDRFKVISKDENIPFEDISCCYENPECQKSVTGVGLEAMDGTREEIWVSDDLLTVDIVEPSPSRGIVRESKDGWGWAEDIDYLSYDYLKGKALEFQPYIDNEEYFNKIRETLRLLGFNFSYGWDEVESEDGDGVRGLYMNRQDRVIWTGTHFDQDTYYDHITDYEDGSHIDILDGRSLIPESNSINESEDGWTWAEQPLVTPFDTLGEGDIVTIYKIKGDYLDVALRNCDSNMRFEEGGEYIVMDDMTTWRNSDVFCDCPEEFDFPNDYCHQVSKSVLLSYVGGEDDFWATEDMVDLVKVR